MLQELLNYVIQHLKFNSLNTTCVNNFRYFDWWCLGFSQRRSSKPQIVLNPLVRLNTLISGLFILTHTGVRAEGIMKPFPFFHISLAKAQWGKRKWSESCHVSVQLYRAELFFAWGIYEGIYNLNILPLYFCLTVSGAVGRRKQLKKPWWPDFTEQADRQVET